MPTTRFEADDGSIGRSRKLRRDATPAERKLWELLRASKLDGCKFRRQQRLGPFFADFLCPAARLVVELDGISHDGPAAQERDDRRTAFIEREGYRVIRFTNSEVLGNVEGVVMAIRVALLTSHAPSPSHRPVDGGPLPLPRGERR